MLKLSKKIKNDIYVYNFVRRGTNVNEVENLTQKSIELFFKGGFNLNKWHPNITSSQCNSNSSADVSSAVNKGQKFDYVEHFIHQPNFTLKI